MIDHHVHLYPPEVASDPGGWGRSRGETLWVALSTRVRKSGLPVQGFPDLDQLLRDMDAAGISQAVLLGWYWERPETCVEHNRFLAACRRRFPERIRFFATVHPRMGEAGLRNEVERARDDGAEGIGELSPHSQGLEEDWPLVWRLAAEFSLSINLHVTDPASKPYPGRTETPLADFLAWASAYPGTRFILAHWGGGLAGSPEALRLPNISFDTAASPLVATQQAALGFLNGAGRTRVLFGSDYPLNLYPSHNYQDFGLARWVEEWRTLAGEAAT
ncbi:MAG: amidohydrolase family protein [Opitutaceae bacterium]|nr:amidohydrolase family protein [Opitutaceae bacterium]